MVQTGTLVLGQDRVGGWLAETLSVLLRVHVGFSVCVGAGMSKLFPGPGEDGAPTPTPPPWFVDQVQGMGFPTPEVFAMIAVLAEVVGGALLALGLLTRWAGLLVAVHFAVAAFAFHKVIPLFDMHIAHLYMWSSLVFFGLGCGRTGLDALIRAKLWRTRASTGA